MALLDEKMDSNFFFVTLGTSCKFQWCTENKMVGHLGISKIMCQIVSWMCLYVMYCSTW